MNAAEAALAVLGSIATVSTAATGLVWWGYKLGWKACKKAAEGQARIESLERQLAENQKQLTALQQAQAGSGHP
jgi:hypothetical protein